MGPQRGLVAGACLCAALVVPGSSRAIVNGTLDVTHDCVVSVHLVAQGLVGSGVLITESWVLTAAHFEQAAPDAIAVGADWAQPGVAVYPIDYLVPHPAWDGTESFDVALAHLEVPATGQPVCPLDTSPGGGVQVGQSVRYVGYGLTSYPDGFVTTRSTTVATVDTVESTWFATMYSGSGPCLGDEGGAAFSIGAEELVVGIVAGVAGACDSFTIDTKVAPLVDGFILPHVLDPPVFVDGFESGDAVRWDATGP